MNEKEMEKIEGTVRALIYQNENNGWTVARMETDDGANLVITGVMPGLGAGESMIACGSYVTHPEYGPQFSVSAYERIMPSTVNGIYQYLAGRAVKGIGPKTARLVVENFGEEAFEVIANAPEKLAEIRGMSLKKALEIQENFLRGNAMRALLEFFTANDLPLYLAPGVYKLYGDAAVGALKEDPYLLCDERFGLDFHEADRVAEQLGLDPQSAVRLRAAALYELTFNLQSGHCFIPRDKLIRATAALCGAEPGEIERHLEELLERGSVVSQMVAGKEMIYLETLFRYENSVADEVMRLLSMKLMPPKNLDKLVRQAEKEHAIEYAPLQKQAVELCFSHALSLVTGGPGTGKTTAVLGMIHALKSNGLSVVLCAPTGRAAKKMTELSGEEAKTLHRLLEALYSPEEGRMKFKRGRENPIDADVIIVDEASMLDISLTASLLDAMKPHTRLVLIGDADQLPPVWAGSVFADLLSCEFVPAVRLTEIFRQAQGSQIVMNAHRINQGLMPELWNKTGDFYFSAAASPEEAVQTVASLVAERIPKKFGIDPQNIQVICPTRQQMCGTVSMNRILQEYLNPAGDGRAEVKAGPYQLRLGDRVMQIKNNYDIVWQSEKTAEIGTGIFNGDTGTITLIDKQEKVLVARFDDKVAGYSFDDLYQLEPAYAITAHKSQGSEYEAVILPVFQAPERLLNRSILYTAVTRAKKLLVLVGKASVVTKMVESNQKNRRYCALKYRLRHLYEERMG